MELENEYTDREKKVIEIVDTSLMTWQQPNIGYSKEELVYKAECYHSALKEIQSLFLQTTLRSEQK